jgi:hypothetical protein
VRVQETGYEVAVASVNHLGSLSDGMRSILTDVSDAFPGDCNVGVRDDLAGLDANPTPVSDDEIGRTPSHGNVDQRPSPMGYFTCRHLNLSSYRSNSSETNP